MAQLVATEWQTYGNLWQSNVVAAESKTRILQTKQKQQQQQQQRERSYDSYLRS